MTQEDILKEVLSDSSISELLNISQEALNEASMHVPSTEPNIEVIKSIISDGCNGVAPRQTFNELKKIKRI